MKPHSSPSLDDLLQVIEKATDKQTLRWTETAEEDTFRAVFGTGLVRIGKDRITDRYTLTLVDREGIMIDEYQPETEGTLLASERLYKKARGQALDIDQKLKAVFANLKSLAGDS